MGRKKKIKTELAIEEHIEETMALADTPAEEQNAKIEAIAEYIIEPVNERDQLIDNIIIFVNNYKGRLTLTDASMMHMIKLYNKYFKLNETFDKVKHCELCKLQVYKRLRKIADAYEKRRK